MPSTPRPRTTVTRPVRRPLDHDSQCCPSLASLRPARPSRPSAGSPAAAACSPAPPPSPPPARGPAYADDDLADSDRRGRAPQARAGDRARHHRPARQRLQLGLLQEHGVRRRRAQRHRAREGRDADQGDAQEVRKRGPVLLLDAGDTIQGTPLAYYYARIEPITDRAAIHPMAAAMNKMRLRRRRARQPRVQLRHRHAARLRVAAGLPAARRQRGRPGDQAAGLPAVRHQEVPRRPGPQAAQGRHPRPGQPGHRDLGQGQRRRARWSSPAWSSRRRSTCPS